MGDFDLKKLEKELESAVEVEAKRQRVDDVKKHAIHSTGSYEEFRQRVLAADLKPVPSTEFEGAFHRQKGNLVAHNRVINRIDGTVGRSKRVTAARDFDSEGPPQAPPKTVMEFGRVWRRQCRDPVSRYRYLRLFKPKRTKKVFANELDGATFGQMGCAIAQCLPAPGDGATDGAGAGAGAAAAAGAGAGAGAASADGEPASEGAGAASDAPGGDGASSDPAADAAWAFKLLRAFSTGNRFALTLKLLGDEDTAAFAQIFDRLEQWAASGTAGTAKADAVARVRAAYGL